MNEIKSVLRTLNWSQARAAVQRVNPAFAAVIDELDPTPDYKLFELTSPFGLEIVHKGLLYLPNDRSDVLCIRNPDFSPDLREELGYNRHGLPMGMTLENRGEMFLPIKDHTVPFLYDVLTPGKIFGTQRLLSKNVSHHPNFLWHVTMGARSLFMLPKVTSTAGYKRIKNHFNIHMDSPVSLADQWHVFRKLANHPDFGAPWSGKVLYFGKKWLEHLDDKAWTRFGYYLYQNAWDASAFWRDQSLWDLVFSLIQQKSNLRPDPYIAQTVKYLIAIAVGVVPGFVPATDDGSAPIVRLQYVFKEIYDLDLYAPTIMQPDFFNWDDLQSFVYYSLHYAAALEFSPRTRKLSNKIVDLDNIQHILNRYREMMAHKRSSLSITPIGKLYKKVDFDCFHGDDGRNGRVRSTLDIPLEDGRFLLDNDLSSFPSESPFINGCVRIKSRKG